MKLNQLTAISPVDGRYGEKTQALRGIFSEYGLIRYRVRVEILWLQALAAHKEISEIKPVSNKARQALDAIIANISLQDGERIKEIEKTTNHDVKAVEYFLKEKVANNPELKAISEFFHFACTSEDINNLCHGLMLAEARNQCLLPLMNDVITSLADMCASHADRPMLARTHGQSASPTTLGKEIGIYAHRLQRQLKQLQELKILGKLNGAVGNFNAHLAAYPDIDWMQISKEFVESLELTWNPHTTQIESHDYMAEYFHILCRINIILIDFCRDLWAYIALGYFHQQPVDGEIGSSTMPHKINPIDFENAEGNLGLANTLLTHLAEKLPVSRWQRDLSGSTVIRTTGTAIAYCLIAYQSCLKGLARLEVVPDKLESDLENAWEVLAEAIQTTMRRYGIDQAYEKLKQMTRGEVITRAGMRDFINDLELPDDVKRRLLALTPASYTGNAEQQARQIIAAVKRCT
ncbi:MAG: adenylosuccinate lyase [Gammaproteobacteria bacterium]